MEKDIYRMHSENCCHCCEQRWEPPPTFSDTHRVKMLDLISQDDLEERARMAHSYIETVNNRISETAPEIASHERLLGILKRDMEEYTRMINEFYRVLKMIQSETGDAILDDELDLK